MFNPINCNGPPFRGIYFYMVFPARVDLFVFERYDNLVLPGSQVTWTQSIDLIRESLLGSMDVHRSNIF